MNSGYPQITFGANFINNAQVKIFNNVRQNYDLKKVAFTKFDPNNSNDLQAMFSAVAHWKGDNHIAGEICNQAMQLSNLKACSPPIEFYILTKQDKEFKKLDYNKILGLAKVRCDEKGKGYLSLLQVKPEIKYGTEKRAVKGAGKAIIDELKKIYTKEIKLISTYFSANFYEKQGFSISDKNTFLYRWIGNSQQKA